MVNIHTCDEIKRQARRRFMMGLMRARGWCEKVKRDRRMG